MPERKVAHADVLAWVQALRGLTSLTDIGLLLADVTRRLQFDHYALAQTQPGQPGITGAHVSNFPDAWVAMLAAQQLLADDPVVLASQRSVAPFDWAQIATLIPLTSRQRWYMESARAHGLCNGFTVPIHTPGPNLGAASGLVSFVKGGDGVLPQANLATAQYLACFAFEAVRRLQPLAGSPAPRLTQRQLDCVVLVARGKSNWVAGQLLGLSDQTVHKYVEAAKARYGVATRTELVVRALHDGQISFADVLPDVPPGALH